MCAEKKEPLEKKKKEKNYNKTETIATQTETILITLLKTFMTKALQTSLFHQKSQLDKMI